MEYRVNYLGEPRPTSVDMMFDGVYRVAVEVKLSEGEVARLTAQTAAHRLELRERSLRRNVYPPARA